MKYFLTILVCLIVLPGCDLLIDRCPYYVPQKWNIGKIEAELTTKKPVLKVGDTIHFGFKLNKYLIDIDSQQMNIDLGVKVFNKITTTANYSDTLDSDFFATDTTIFKVFYQYFDLLLNKGRMINAYTFECDLNDDAWELEITYVLKKPGYFRASIYVENILTSESDLGEGVCMQGDFRTFGARLIWKESEYNRIDYLFNDDKEKYPEYYGFIVEE